MSALSIQAQGTAFTYQGKLSLVSGNANGSYDLTFTLFATNSGPGQVGSTVTNTATAVSNGLFSVVIDFGGNFPGADRWLEIGVRTNGNGAFTTLAPRQKITPAPYAITAVNLAGVVANNTISTNNYQTLAGGFGNICAADDATVGGGFANSVFNYAGTVGGGADNTCGGIYATIPGGFANLALGYCSFAAGRQAQANHNGTFVWSDNSGTDFASTGDNQFLVRATGGVGIGVNAPQQQLSVGAGLNIDQGNANTGTPVNALTFGSSSGEGIGSRRAAGPNQYGLDFFASYVPRMSIANQGNVGIGTTGPQEKLHVAGKFIRVDGAGNEQVYMGGDGGGNDAQFGSLSSTVTDVVMWNPTRGECMNVNAKAFNLCSDRNMKDVAGEVHAQDVLNKVLALPVQRWNFKGETDIQHIGPMAQDFHAAFGLGKDDKHIATVDADGIALAAIQGLNEKVEKKNQRSEDRIQKLEAENARAENAPGQARRDAGNRR